MTDTNCRTFDDVGHFWILFAEVVCTQKAIFVGVRYYLAVVFSQCGCGVTAVLPSIMECSPAL